MLYPASPRCAHVRRNSGNARTPGPDRSAACRQRDGTTATPRPRHAAHQCRVLTGETFAPERSLEIGGRPGERITARPVNTAAHPGGRPMNTSISRLRPPADPGTGPSLAFTDALHESGIAGSIGSVGDALDNALMKSTIGLYKTELVNREKSWTGRAEAELETATWFHWYNTTVDRPPPHRRWPNPLMCPELGGVAILGFRPGVERIGVAIRTLSGCASPSAE